MPFDLSEEYIELAEARLGARLPESYRRAMTAKNGGELAAGEDDWMLYPIRVDSGRKRLSRTVSDIVAETQSCSGWSGFPINAVAFAGNGFGDQLVFLKYGDSYDSTVYAWQHGSGELVLLAGDFSELVRR